MGVRLVSLTYTHPSTQLIGGLHASQWGLGSSLRLVLSSFSFCSFLLACTSCLRKLCSSICHLGLQNCISCFCKLCSCLYLVNYHFATVIYFLANCHLANCAFSFQCYAMRYGLIAHGAKVDLRSFPSVRAHFDGLSSEEVSRNSTFFYYFLLHVSQGPLSDLMCCHRSYGVLRPMFLLLQILTWKWLPSWLLGLRSPQRVLV